MISDNNTKKKIIESFFLYLEEQNIFEDFKDYRNSITKNNFFDEKTLIIIFAELCKMFLKISFFEKMTDEVSEKNPIYSVKNNAYSEKLKQKYNEYKVLMLKHYIFIFTMSNKFFLDFVFDQKNKNTDDGQKIIFDKLTETVDEIFTRFFKKEFV